MRATFQRAGGGAGRSQANAPEARRWLDWPPPVLAITSPAITTRASTPTTAPRLRVTAQTPPSPSSGPPLLSASPSPPPFWGMLFFGGLAGGGAAGRGRGFGAAGRG